MFMAVRQCWSTPDKCYSSSENDGVFPFCRSSGLRWFKRKNEQTEQVATLSLNRKVVLVRVSVTVLKRYDHKRLREGRVYFTHTSKLQRISH